MNTIIASILLFASLHFPMEPVENYIEEVNSGRQYFVEGYNYAASVDGVEGGALRLDGYSNFIEVDMSKYPLSDSTLTISFVIAAETYPMMVLDAAQDVWTELIGTMDDTNKSGWAFRLSSQGNYGFQVYVGSSKIACYGSAKLLKYQWNHFVATIDVPHKKLNLYLNGEFLKTANIPTGVIKHGTQTLLIGKGRDEVTYAGAHLNTFNGIIDEIHIDSRIWTADEIAGMNTASALNLADRDTIFINNFYRPRYHAMPAANWTNESHGLVYYDNRYHLFFQKNGNGPYMSRLHWGHVSSSDMLHWKEEKIAIAPDKTYDIKGCWSGAVFVDSLLSANQPRILYTSVDNAHASISIARPLTKSLLDWEKDVHNPIISGTPAGYEADFRDPYFFRNGEDAYIIVGTKKNGVGANTLHKYVNGGWEYAGTFMQGTDAGSCGTFNEMTNVTQMPDGRWLVTATPLDGDQGVRTIYWTGTINADGTFAPDTNSLKPRTFEMESTSKWGYGLLSPTIYRHGDKVLALGIVPDKLPTYQNVMKLAYAHTMSFPRELLLDEDGNVLQKPFSGLADLRTAEHFSARDTVVNGSLSLDPICGRQWEVKTQWVVGENDFRLDFLKSGSQSAKLTYHSESGKLSLVMGGINRMSNDNGSFNGTYEMILPVKPVEGDTLLLDVYFDNSICEVFVNEKWASSIRVFCQTYNADGLEIFTTGDVNFVTIDAWGLGEITTYHPWTTPQRNPDKEKDPMGWINTHQNETMRKTVLGGQVFVQTPEHIYDMRGGMWR
ncbi:MAG: LamG-like jellyroll fold domain-containing protein [Paludibacteraceae bacterium]